MSQIGVTKIGSWSEYIYFKHIFVLDMFSMEETPGCSFFKCQASALASDLQRGVESLWDHAGLVGGRIEHAGNQPSVVSIHILGTCENLQTDYFERPPFLEIFVYQTHPKTVSIFFWAFGEVELLLHCVRTGARTFPPADEDTFRRHISVRAGTWTKTRRHISKTH